MKTIQWLVRREFWEHKGMFVWTPLIIAGLIALFVSGASYTIVNHGILEHAEVNGTTFSMHGMPPEMRADLASTMAAAYMAVAMPLLMSLTVTMFFYCLGALYDERRDRSILFWKSLPVSDRATVLSKAATGLLLVPLLHVVVAIVLALFVLTVLATVLALQGVNLFPLLLSDPHLYSAPLALIGLVPIYVLWALPTIGWLMLVSSWARSKVFLWAVGVPLLSIVALKYFSYVYNLHLDIDWFAQHVVMRALGSIAPGSWIGFERFHPEQMLDMSNHVLSMRTFLASSWALLARPSIWVGAAAGVAMLAGAVRMRRYRDEG